MPATKRTGVKIRPLPDWFSDDLAALHAGQGASVGNLSEIGIYNNANDGTVLRVYAIDVFIGANTHVNYEYVKGKAGATWGETFVPITHPNVAAPWGIPMAFTSAVCLGSHFGGTEGSAGSVKFMAPGWPLAIIQPGWSFIMETNNPNVTLEATWWFLQTPY